MFTITCVSRHCPKEVAHSLAHNKRRLFQSKHSITDRVAKFCINVLWNFPVAVVMKLEKLSKIIHLIIFIEQNILLPHQCNH
ncbi:hypothetical protein T02_1463 [Trichinella nativa]|uniref:Uncharacterized protein n=1 Tax=Trichinella nativa TaxID=6335 RepID=A0A0V1L4K8_9BILA|nr:hypothetical protein T06_4746 [Trichinella sp. T6]KRZ54461.1 hypothetical protein T02_1463 [Trichinella nativa]